MRKHNLVLVAFCLLTQFTFGQGILSLQKAIEIALKNNYAITIATNESQIAKNNATIGNAGMLPEISLYGARNYTGSNTKQEYQNDSLLNRSGVNADNAAAGIALKWTLFDGLRMFADFNRLKELNVMGELQAKLKIENTVEEIIVSYYSIVKQKRLIGALDSALTIYAERVRIAEEKFTIGNGSKSDLLQAKVDLNEQKSNMLKERVAFKSEKLTFNQLLAQKTETDFDVLNEIEVNKTLQLAETKDSMLNNNKSLLFYNRNVNAFQYSLRESRSLQLPQLSFSTAYDFSRSKNEVGFFLLNQNLGYNTGLTLSWTLFNGLNVRREIKNSQLMLENAKITLDYEKSKLESELQTAFNNYQYALEALSLEEENAKLAQENASIMLQRFQLASATTIEVKTAQQSYTDGLNRLVQARFDAKVAETSLLKLKGELVK